ncbi:TIGR00159 family protein [Falseniella ignava CCUG 37419]|uniref:Diadenylate cyclase n=1 Tax=Falseniella ignava CCUG 37419 TaxID=883112 RepID=K1LVH3_9LACT|nr:TIGR00159 family protein [Falseniella ignava CCUG 37419]
MGVIVQEFISQYITDQPLIRLLDILVVWYLIYLLLMNARGSQIMNLLKGVGIIITAKFITGLIGLHTVDWLIGQVLSWGVVALIILFQPELRRALEVIGRDLFRNKRYTKNASVKMIEELEKSLYYMSRRKIGALISIEGTDSLEEYVATGIPLKAETSNQLLINIFIPNTPLHDGAVIIKDFKIMAASCYLPLSNSTHIPKELGTRHRAAIGLSELTDAVTLIVSEETGDISIAVGDELYRGVQGEELTDLLVKYLYTNDEEAQETLWNQIISFLTVPMKGGNRND